MKVEQNNLQDILNLVELNAILYYADFISLKETNTTVTDNCKYFFIYKTPINSAFIANSKPFYDPTDKYFMQAKSEYEAIKDRFGDDASTSFVANICNLSAAGCVDARMMLTCIHQYSDKYTRKQAFRRYNDWIETQTYSHITINEKGDTQRQECTRYIAHIEIGTEFSPEVHYVKRITE